jgi:hypothetical protein
MREELPPTERMEANMSSEDMTTNDGAGAELSLDDLEGAAGGGRHTRHQWGCKHFIEEA